MRVRALDAVNDWTYGKGQNNYKQARAAISQNIQTRVSSFLGNCFFDLGAGIDWFTFLGGSKDQVALNLAISSVILNTQYVQSILSLSINLSSDRNFTVIYSVNTVFGVVQNLVTFAAPGGLITTEAGDVITTESGIGLST